MEANEFDLSAVLGELDLLLAAESEALRKLDHGTLDELTSQKLDLLDRLARVDRSTASREDVARLGHARELAFQNQLLLVNARELVRGVLHLSASNRVGNGGTLLEIRG